MTAPAPVASTSKNRLELTPEILNSFKPSRVFKGHNEPTRSFTSISFDSKGEHCITAAEDEALQIFNCRTGKHSKQIYSKKYGCHLARFTHSSNNVVFASTKEDNQLRYMSTHDNTFIRYFKGHKSKVTSLDMSPVDDTLLSAATDDTVRLWDLRSPNCQGRLNVVSHPCVSYDPTGTVFAVMLNMKSTVLMYDIRNYDKAPFLSENLKDPVLFRKSFPPVLPTYTSCRFSNDGKYVLIGTAGKVHYVLDSFNGGIVARLEEENSGMEMVQMTPDARVASSGEDVCWSPNSRFVLAGSPDGKISVWDVNPPEGSQPHRAPPGPENTLRPMKVLDGHKGNPARVLGFNPRLGMFVSGGMELAFWLPSKDEMQIDP